MVIGHQKIIEFLLAGIAKNRLAHAYLFVGPEQIGKKKVAVEFVKGLQCEKPKGSSTVFYSCGQCKSCLAIEKNQHPDVLFVGPEPGSARESEKLKKNQELKIEQVRQIQRRLALSSFWGRRKIAIIDSVEQLTREAANCLLKTLEEPTKNSLLILISPAWQRLLPTIISRCQLIKFSLVGKAVIVKGLGTGGFEDKTKIEQAVKLACGRPGIAINLLSDADLWISRQQKIDDLEKLIGKDLVIRFKYVHKLSQDISLAQETLAQWLVFFHDQFLASLSLDKLRILNAKNIGGVYSLDKIRRAIKNIQEAQELLKESSFNSRLILENLMLKL